MNETRPGEPFLGGDDASRRPISDPLPDPGRERRHFKFWMVGLALLAVPLVGYLLLGAVVSLMFWSITDVDVLIQEDEARERMASVLKTSYKVTLDPADRIVEAHRTSGGFQGDGTNWYLIRLAPASARRFEADFTAHAPAGPLARDAARVIDPAIIKPLGWEARPPPDARIFNFNDGEGTCAIFFDDKFFYRFDHF